MKRHLHAGSRSSGVENHLTIWSTKKTSDRKNYQKTFATTAFWSCSFVEGGMDPNMVAFYTLRFSLYFVLGQLFTTTSDDHRLVG